MTRVMPADLDARIRTLLDVLRTHGYRHREEPFQLVSGEWSHDFVDAKAGLAQGAHLRLACAVMRDLVAAHGIAFDAVGGLTMGADQFAHGIALLDDARWFVVRKQAKGRGTNQLVEGATLGKGVRALVVDDVVTTGGSLLAACDAVAATGATVAGATTLLERGERAAPELAQRGIPYLPVFTYRDLGIAPVG